MKNLYQWGLLPLLCLTLSVVSTNQLKGALPITNFTFEISGTTVNFTNLSFDADSYIWDFGDGNSSLDPNPTHLYSGDGTYMVKLKSSNNSGTTSEVQVVIIGGNYQQYPYTANEFVPPYTQPFRPGTNLGYNPPWTDRQLADLAAGNETLGVPGIGAKTIRPFLPDHFLEEYGYDIRLGEFDHYASLGLDKNTLVIGFPSEEHRDPTFHCPDIQSETFDNMYTSIWDNGENGTPVNDSNHLALYMYKLVHLYGDKVTFWEIWNEPGFDFTYSKGWLPPGQPGNWWDNNPEPCDYKLHAPIFHYVRILRICYEVIKYIDPEAYITLGSVGFPSFMDAVLRNTDNPSDGSVNNMYPLGGGAYFDVVSIHSYPHFDGTLREWSNDINDFIYSRHSDQAANGIKRTKNFYQDVLYNYGYDGTTYPEKHWTITEINIPRQPFGDAIGSEEAQRNFIIKAYIESVKERITEMHVYDLAEPFYAADATNPFHSMGLYQRLFDVLPYNETVNDEGIAYKTASDLLYNSHYDTTQTAALNLPDSINGAAFLDANGNYTYVLWAKTTIDQSEVANATYSFPTDFNITTLHAREWNFSQTEIETEIAGNGLLLTGSPLFLTDDINTTLIAPTAGFELSSTNLCAPASISYNNTSSENGDSWLWTFEGGNPSSSTLENPNVTYDSSGHYAVTLIVTNAAGADTLHYDNYVMVDLGLPTADFTSLGDSLLITFVNGSTNASSYTWDLDNGFFLEEVNPVHEFDFPGYFDIEMVAYNNCGTDTILQELIVMPNSIIPQSAFTSDVIEGCVPLTVQFSELATANTTSWFWQFQNGTPESSSEQNPIVVFNEPGDFFASLKAINAAGEDNKYINDYIIVSDTVPPVLNFTGTVNNMQVEFNNTSTNATDYFWEFGDGNTSTEENPVHDYTSPGVYMVILTATNACALADTIVQDITINIAPEAMFSTVTPTGCAPFQVQFEDNSTNNPDNWLWAFPGGTPSSSIEQNPLVSYPFAGQYSVSLEVSNTAGDDIMNILDLIIIDTLPTAGFSWTADQTTISFDNSSTNNSSSFWDFGDGNTSTDSNPNHDFLISGDYPVSLIVENACGADTLTETINIMTNSTENVYSTMTLQVSPNPSDGKFNVHLIGEAIDEMELTIYDVLGQVILRKAIDFEKGWFDGVIEIDGTSGLYWLEVSGEDHRRYVQKVLVR